MATPLTKPVRRRVDAITRRGVVVTLYPNNLIGLREAKCRREHTVPLSRVFRLACEVTAESDRKAALARRNERRAERGLAPLKSLVKRGKL